MQALLTSGVPVYQNLAVEYGALLGSASSVALNKLDFGAVAGSISGGTLSPGPGAKFPVPVTCPLGQTVNAVVCNGFAAVGPGRSVVPAGIVPLPTSYVGLNSLRGNFPVTEKTSLWSRDWTRNGTTRTVRFCASACRRRW